MFAGAKTRFPLLFPALQPASVASAVLDAVRKNKTKVILPNFMKLLEIAQVLLPTRVFYRLTDFFIDFKNLFVHLKRKTN